MQIDPQVTSKLQTLGQSFADAFQRRDFAAVGAFYTDDATILPPGSEAIVGQTNIQLFWGRNRWIQELRFEPIGLKALGSDVVCETGVMHMRVGGPRQPVREVTGKYVFLWLRIGGWLAVGASVFCAWLLYGIARWYCP